MNTKLIIIILLILLCLPAGGPLFHPGLYDRVDAFLYISRFFEFDRAFSDGQFPPIWAPDYDAGYGNPIFLFYSPLFFFSAQLLRLFGFGHLQCIKTIVILSFIFSGISMFIFAREFWGKFGGFLAAIAYVYAPYHLVAVYATSAFGTGMAFVWFPLILWSFYKLAKEKKIIYLCSAALTYAALILTHNIMAMLFTGIIILYMGFLFLLNRDRGALKRCPTAFLLGLGLSAFFWIPALIEKKYVLISKFTRGYFEFHKHFMSLGNFFFSDTKSPLYTVPLSVQMGPTLILLAILSLAIAAKMSNSVDRDKKYSIIFFLSLIPIYIFMMLPVSKWVWQLFALLQFTQFPWRLSALLVLSLSFVSGAVLLFSREEKGVKNQVIMVSVFSALLISRGFGYMRVPAYIPAPPKWVLTAERIRRADSIFRPWREIERDPIDYRPKWVKKVTQRLIADNDRLEVIGGEAKVLYANIRTSRYFFNVLAEKDSLVRIHTYWFPGWKAYIDGKEVSIDYSNEYGLMDIGVPGGEHKIYLGLGDTPLRRSAKLISLASLLILGGVLVKRKVWSK